MTYVAQLRLQQVPPLLQVAQVLPPQLYKMISKTKLYLILGGVWALSLVGIYAYTRIHYKGSSTVQPVEVPYYVPTYIKDSSGITHAQYKSVKISRDQYRHQLDSITKLVGIKPKQVIGTGDYSTNTDLNVGGDTVIVHDTLYEFNKINPYYSINGKVSPKSWEVNLSLQDTLHTITYIKNHLLQPDETIVDISNSNPFVHLGKGRSVTITQRRAKFTIGPYIGYQVYPKEQFSIGISIQHPFITIR